MQAHEQHCIYVSTPSCCPLVYFMGAPVLWELQPQRAHERSAGGGGVSEAGVEVRQQAVPHAQHLLASRRHLRPGRNETRGMGAQHEGSVRALAGAMRAGTTAAARPGLC